VDVMNLRLHRGAVLAAACALALALGAPAADDKAVDSKALDRYLYSSLRHVINHGVDLYNNPKTPLGADECYQHFRESLEELAPVLSAHPDLQKLIKTSLDKVETDPEWRAKMAARATMPNPQQAPVDRQKAFALRAVFNEVRAGLSPDGRKIATDGGGAGPAGASTVKGRVYSAGKLLAKGVITFLGGDGRNYSDQIEADGSYTLEKIPAGSYRITITGDPSVSPRYADARATPLAYNVANGANTCNLELPAQ
jgi:hypothetical protein